MFNLKELKVLITGASSGIGRALAFEFAEKGAKLTLASRKLDSLRRVVEEIKSSCPDAQQPLIARCDVTSKRDVKRLVMNNAHLFGGIDVFIRFHYIGTG